tara:strand:- start:13013 stop:13777 length:765 start_codon:yes stop_codon:yes gene_type:complete
MAVIMPPSECPSCSSPLIFINDILYCKNKSCSEQQAKLLENFASKMKIKGLGRATIQKLKITEIHELYELKENEIIETLGSEKLGSKLYQEILKSHDAPLNLLLPALGIPLVGQTATNKLATVFNSLWDIDRAGAAIAGVGPKTIESLLQWKEDNWYLLSALPLNLTFEKTLKTSNQGTVCITGKLSSYKTKAEATTVLNQLGYEVKSTVTKDVTILVNESGIESAKVKKARESGVTIITNLSELIGDQYGYTS